MSNTSHTLCTPFPTLLSASVWTDKQTWYTRSVRWSLPPDIRNMLSIMGKVQDAKIAETMLQQKTVFWELRDTWAEWAPRSLSNRFRWIVPQFRFLHSARMPMVPMVQSLHRDEFHCHGNINVTSPGKEILLRQIASLKRDALMMSLLDVRLGKLPEGPGSGFLATY